MSIWPCEQGGSDLSVLLSMSRPVVDPGCLSIQKEGRASSNPSVLLSRSSEVSSIDRNALSTTAANHIEFISKRAAEEAKNTQSTQYCSALKKADSFPAQTWERSVTTKAGSVLLFRRVGDRITMFRSSGASRAANHPVLQIHSMSTRSRLEVEIAAQTVKRVMDMRKAADMAMSSRQMEMAAAITVINSYGSLKRGVIEKSKAASAVSLDASRITSGRGIMSGSLKLFKASIIQGRKRAKPAKRKSRLSSVSFRDEPNDGMEDSVYNDFIGEF